ncbi:hypothetical protein B0H14DRAFT_163459 [Mycena olivaceomarginata]|nr:hypothetical protein B0H14DRAFT_163459 [Mycena olivaceomarginata]
MRPTRPVKLLSLVHFIRLTISLGPLSSSSPSACPSSSSWSDIRTSRPFASHAAPIMNAGPQGSTSSCCNIEFLKHVVLFFQVVLCFTI